MKKILFIDDDKLMMSSFYEELKEKFKFEVTWLRDAESVLVTLADTDYDAVIMDIMMPVPYKIFNSDEQRRSEDGLSTGKVLIEKIREKHPILPILVYTAKAWENNADQYCCHIRKPELADTIIKELMKLIERN